jgi:hypothetical protein
MVRFWMRGSLTFYSEPGYRLLQGFKQVGNVVKNPKILWRDMAGQP